MVSILGNYYEAKPVIIEQSSILLCASGSIVLGLELTSGELLFSFKGHADVVTSIYYSDFQSSKVVSASKDGAVLTWDLQTRRVLSSCSVGSPVHNILFPDFTNNEHTGKPDMYLVLKRHADAADKSVGHPTDAYKFVIYDAVNSKIRRNICEIIHPSAAVCRANIGGTEVVFAASKRKLCLVIAESRVGYKTMCPANHSITCVTMNAHRDVIVTGHSNGEILIWHDIRNWISRETSKTTVLSELKSGELIAIPPPTSTIMHWHAHAVVAVSTNIDGSMIYSGGEEGVLVVWQTTTGKKAFVPHLGAAMAHVTASSLFPLAAVTTNNNSLRVINTSSLLESWTLSSLCVGPFMDHSVPSDRYAKSLLSIDPKSSLLACNGYPGQVQLFDIGMNTVKNIHEVVQYNRVSRTEKHTKIFVPSVSLFKFQAFHTTKSGSSKYLLASVDVRKGEEFAAESSLKFWSWSDMMNSYKLVTHVPRPHGAARVTCIAFSPSHPLYTCATSATDGSVKVWRLDPAVAAGKMFGDAHWSCVYSFTYRAVAADGLSFSADGSVLAVAHANTVSLWDPVSLSLRASVVAPGASNNISFTAFIEPTRESGAYLVVGGKYCMAAYDLLTMSMAWRLDGKLSGFCVAPSPAHVVSAAPDTKKISTAKKGKKQRSNSTEEVETVGDLAKEGWISVCRQVGSSGMDRDHSNDDNEQSTELTNGVDSKATWELLVLSPLPSKTVVEEDKVRNGEEDTSLFHNVAGPSVVCTSRLAAEATSTVFWSPSDSDSESFYASSGSENTSGNSEEKQVQGPCVLAATTSGELILTNSIISQKEAESGTESHTRLFPKDGTALGWAENVSRRNETKAAALPAGISFKSKGKQSAAAAQISSENQVKDGWLGDFFDGVSGNVPPVASIYDDFMSTLMKKSATSGESNGKPAVVPDNADVNSEDGVAAAAKQQPKNKSEKKTKKFFEPQHVDSFSGRQLML